jgi:TIR domain
MEPASEQSGRIPLTSRRNNGLGVSMTDRTIPEVYVLWHPGCQLGEALASSIYAWLRPGHGLGPDVFFRSLPRPDGGADPLPLPLPGEERRDAAGTAPQRDPNPKVTPRRNQVVTMQILVLLIDFNMVADASWRYWLEQLSLPSPHKSGPTRVFLPVALDLTSFNIPSSIGRLNFLRPSGLPLPVNPTPAAIATVARSLCKQLTESLCRLLLGHLETRTEPADTAATSGMSPAKIAIFLSHAKKDGHKPARRIRDYIYAQTQLAAFFDENDIPFGTAFAHVIQSGVGESHTAALIVILSAVYATRPWCRRELSVFRQPVLEWTQHADSVAGPFGQPRVDFRRERYRQPRACGLRAALRRRSLARLRWQRHPRRPSRAERAAHVWAHGEAVQPQA